MARPRFAIIGCGSIGKRHLRNLLELGEKNIVAFDPRDDRRAEAATLGVATIGDLAALLDMRPHAVLVTSPSKLHVAHAAAAAERGCHLFIEKPISDEHTADLDRLIDLVRENQVVSLVGCNLRFHPGLLRAKEIISEDALGRIVALRAEFGQYLPDWHPWEDYRQGYSARRALGGGVILDAIHELDYARWLMGDVVEVAAMADHLSRIEIDTEDTAVVLLKFATGSFGEIHLDYVQRIYTRSCRVIGDEGTLAWDFADGGTVRIYRAHDKRWDIITGPSGWDVNTMYVDELRHFLACVRGEEAPKQDVAQATTVLDIALAAKRAAATSTVVGIGQQN